MKKMIAVMLVAGIFVSAAISIAADDGQPTAAAPTLVKGERWVFSGGAVETFLRQENDKLVFFREDNRFTGERYRTKELNLMYDIKDGAQINTRRPHSGLLNFPISIGKEWSMPYQNKGTWKRNRYEVVSVEKITIKAGTFDAFRIEGLDKRDDKQYGIKVVAWYAPAVKTVVKITGEDETNHMGIEGWNWELVSYEPPK